VALARARQCREYLGALCWPEPILGDSGNGAHLLYLIDLPNDGASRELLESILKVLAFRFDDSSVEIDPGTYNAGRVIKVYGTVASKGDSVSERPHRLSRLIDVPDSLQPVSVELLTELANQVPGPAPLSHASPSGKLGLFDLDQWLAEHNPWFAEHNIELIGPTTWNHGRRWILSTCAWNEEHRAKSGYIVQFPTGAIGAGCLHKSCEGKDWPALRDLIEPDWKKMIPPTIRMEFGQKENYPSKRRQKSRHAHKPKCSG
jgi:hypothetical protein